MYKAAYQALKAAEPLLEKLNCKTKLDFNRTEIYAWKEEFPECELEGCNFHFQQAVHRKLNGM